MNLHRNKNYRSQKKIIPLSDLLKNWKKEFRKMRLNILILEETNQKKFLKNLNTLPHLRSSLLQMLLKFKFVKLNNFNKCIMMLKYTIRHYMRVKKQVLKSFNHHRDYQMNLFLKKILLLFKKNIFVTLLNFNLAINF